MSDINNHKNFIPASSIKIITIDVTEKIHDNFIKDFIKTTLETNSIILDNNTYISYNFIPNNSLYEIYVVYSTLDDLLIAPDILTVFYKSKENKTTDLFILKDFFVVFKDKKLYCFKSFQESSTHEDIKLYVTQTYKLHLDNIYIIDENKFNKLKLLYTNDDNTVKKSNFCKLKDDNTILAFIIFISISIIIFCILLYNYYFTTHNTLSTKLTTIKNKYEHIKQTKHNKQEPINNNKVSLKLIELFKYIKLKNLITQRISYERDIISLALLYKEKDKLLNFLTIYPTTTTIEGIEFIKEQGLYKMVIKIEI